VRFVETTRFTRRIVRELSDDEYRDLQEALLHRPTLGDLMPGTSGVRKLRWREEHRGKRGGLRIIYYWHAGLAVFVMLFIYGKNEQKDLTPEQRRMLARVIREEFK
jgi:mRNA-degrading endonuclease RelE of RelBE toxin-antitoxin system